MPRLNRTRGRMQQDDAASAPTIPPKATNRCRSTSLCCDARCILATFGFAKSISDLASHCQNPISSVTWGLQLLQAQEEKSNGRSRFGEELAKRRTREADGLQFGDRSLL